MGRPVARPAFPGLLVGSTDEKTVSNTNQKLPCYRVQPMKTESNHTMRRFWLLTYREKSGALIVANKGRVFTDEKPAHQAFESFVMHTGCESVALWECTAAECEERVNTVKTPVCEFCGSESTEYYGAQVHCFACGAVFRYPH